MNIKKLTLIFLVFAIIIFSGCRKNQEKTETILTTTSTIPTTEEIAIPDDGSGVGNVDQLIERGVLITEKSATEENHDISEVKPAETNATEPKPTGAKPMPTEAKPSITKPTEPKPTESKPTEPKPTEPPVNVGPCCEYDKYLAMSPAEQEAYMRTFSNPLEFIQWSQDAEAEHKAHDDTIVVEGGDLNIGDFME